MNHGLTLSSLTVDQRSWFSTREYDCPLFYQAIPYIWKLYGVFTKLIHVWIKRNIKFCHFHFWIIFVINDISVIWSKIVISVCVSWLKVCFFISFFPNWSFLSILNPKNWSETFKSVVSFFSSLLARERKQIGTPGISFCDLAAMSDSDCVQLSVAG